MKVGMVVCMILSWFVAAHAQEATSDSPVASNKDNSSYVICRNERQVRTIRVDLGTASCKAIYTKDGKDDVVGKSATPDLCYEVVQKIRANLEKSVWKCKDVNPERVSFTTE